MIAPGELGSVQCRMSLPLMAIFLLVRTDKDYNLIVIQNPNAEV
jgi:hypothetical protein